MHRDSPWRLGAVGRGLAALALLLCLGGTDARAQSVALVASNDPQALVFADSTWLGPAHRGTFGVPAGTRSIRVVPSGIGAWGVAPVLRTLPAGQDTVRVEAAFPYGYRLESTPFTAHVYLENGGGRESLGPTPVLLSLDAPLEGTLVFERDGFAPVALTPKSSLWNHQVAVLVPAEGRADRPLDVSLELPDRGNRWMDYAAVGVAAVGGAMAVHYKIKADRRYDVYRETGDPALRPRIEALDTRSAVALGAMQVGVGVLAFRLIFR